MLEGEGPFTIFAPSDQAFERLPEGTVQTLLKPENKQQLVDILKYHIVSGRVYADQAAKATQASTLLGRFVETSANADGLRINKSLVEKADIETANGVVHVIDSVLLPQPMGPSQAMHTLQGAIRRGVPIFNRGDHGECADIYSAACRSIIDSGNDQIPHDVFDVLKKAIDRAEHIRHASMRAWVLRHGMDSALADLTEMSLPKTSTQTSDRSTDSPIVDDNSPENGRVLFDFGAENTAAGWQTVNDGVMGGVSEGRFQINDKGIMEFYGTLSLANNGGFASVRSKSGNLDLKDGDVIVARIRGDGRSYYLNLGVPSLRIAYSYRAPLQTKSGEWQEVRVPLKDFQATSFGKPLQGAAKVDASKVNSIGFVLADKKAGPFKLEVESIRVTGS